MPQHRGSVTAAGARLVHASVSTATAAGARGAARFMVAATAKVRIARRVAIGGLAAVATWYAGMDWGELARRLGPAWPGNFRPPPRVAVPIQGRAKAWQ